MLTSAAIAIAESNLSRARDEKFALHKNLLRVYPPYWAEDDDDGMKFFEEHRFLLEHGQIVWGCVVQANKFLWMPSDIMAGGTVIYSHGARDDYSLQRLLKTSRSLAKLKHGPPRTDPCENAYRTMLVGEHDYALGLPVPPTMSDGQEAINTTVLFPRSQMEGKMLGQHHFPLLVHPEKLTAVMVPSIFWSDEFKATWRIGLTDAPPDETAELFAPRGAWARFRIGMGSAFHWRNMFYLLVAIAAFSLTPDYFFYHADHSPVVAKSMKELRAIPSDEFVEFTAPLQLNQKLRTRQSRKDHWLIPISDTKHSVFTTRRKSDHDASSYTENKSRSAPETFRGRLYRERPGEEWRFGFKHYFARNRYKEHNIKVPHGFIVIDESIQPSYFKAILSGGFLLIMIVLPLSFISRIVRTYRIFRHDDRELLAKHWRQREVLAEEDPEDYD